MENIFLSFLLIICSTRACFGMAAGLTLQDAIQRADVIAHIDINDDLEVIPQFTRTASKDGTITLSTSSGDIDQYHKVATASVVHAFKGAKEGDQLKIQHTNGYGCPNVVYRVGGEYIVFLRKDADLDSYVTMNFYAGQFRVESEQVVAFYLMDGYQHPDDLRLPFGEVSRFLTEAIQQNKTAHQAEDSTL